jgi:hypothetical protein
MHTEFEKGKQLLEFGGSEKRDILSISPVRTPRNAPGGKKISDEDPNFP